LYCGARRQFAKIPLVPGSFCIDGQAALAYGCDYAAVVAANIQQQFGAIPYQPNAAPHETQMRGTTGAAAALRIAISIVPSSAQ